MTYRLILLFLTLTTSLQGLILEDLIDKGELRGFLAGKRVGYYTGSFDPVHHGHQGFAKGVIDAGLCDYVLIIPAWGGDHFKDRAPTSVRIEMLYALFANDPYVIVTSLSPQEVQRALTKEVPHRKIKDCSVVEPIDASTCYIGLVGSDTALSLAVEKADPKDEVNRVKRLQVFMRGVSIPDRHAKTTIGAIMALPASSFIVGHRQGDDLSILNGFISDRHISAVYESSDAAHVSSTKVKKRLNNGEPVSDLIDPAVLEIIHHYNLYADPQ